MIIRNRCRTASGISLLLTAESGADGIHGQLHLLGVDDNLPVQRPLALVGLLDSLHVAPIWTPSSPRSTPTNRRLPSNR